MEERMAIIETKLTDLKDQVTKFCDGNDKQHEKITQMIVAIDEKKADRTVVEEIRADIRRGVWIVITSVLIALLALVIKQ
jgi:hypothetical protein